MSVVVVRHLIMLTSNHLKPLVINNIVFTVEYHKCTHILHGPQSFDNISIKFSRNGWIWPEYFKINLKEKILVIKKKLGQKYNYFNIYTFLKQQK